MAICIVICFIKLFKDFDGDKLIEQLEQYLAENEL